MGCCSSYAGKELKTIQRVPKRKSKYRVKDVSTILLKNKNRFNKRVVLCLCSYFTLEELAKYSQISKLFYEVTGHKKVLKLFIVPKNTDYEVINVAQMGSIATTNFRVNSQMLNQSAYQSLQSTLGDMGRSNNTFGVFKEPENVTDTLSFMDMADNFDIIIDTNARGCNEGKQVRSQNNVFKSPTAKNQHSSTSLNRLQIEVDGHEASAKSSLRSSYSQINYKKGVHDTPTFEFGQKRLNFEEIDKLTNPQNSIPIHEMEEEQEGFENGQVLVETASTEKSRKKSIHQAQFGGSKFGDIETHQGPFEYNEPKIAGNNEVSDQPDSYKYVCRSHQTVCASHLRNSPNRRSKGVETRCNSTVSNNTMFTQNKNLAECSFHDDFREDSKFEGSLGSFRSFENPSFINA